MPRSKIIYPDITPEERAKRFKEIEAVLSKILKTKVKLVLKDEYK